MSDTMTTAALMLCRMLDVSCASPELLYNAASDQPAGSPAHYDSMLVCPTEVKGYCAAMIGDDDCIEVAVRRDERRGWVSVVSLCRAKNRNDDEMEPDS